MDFEKIVAITGQDVEFWFDFDSDPHYSVGWVMRDPFDRTDQPVGDNVAEEYRQIADMDDFARWNALAALARRTWPAALAEGKEIVKAAAKLRKE